MSADLDVRAYARAMRKAPTEAEYRMWGLLRRRNLGGLKFRRQAPVGRFIVDFLCFHPRLIVELDGSQHVDSDHDARRDAWLRAQGFKVIRIGNGAVFENPEDVCRRILIEAGIGSVSPSSSRARTGSLRDPVRG